MRKLYSLIFIVWIAVCLLGALPYFLGGYVNNFTDALFESVSGFTTTGASILINTDKPLDQIFPAWLLLWRSLSQWIGGMGALFTFAAIPIYAAGGFQLKKIDMENSSGQKILVRFNKFIFYLFLIYISLTALQFILLLLFGADLFGALTRAFSTISTGGFYIKSNSAAFSGSASVEWIQIIFMFLAGFNFYLIWMVFFGKARNIFRSSEARTYTGIILTASVIITIALTSQGLPPGTALQQAFFNVTSLISTTGFLTGDLRSWSFASQGVLFFLLFTGGCSYSAAGGVKVIRYIMLGKQALNEIKRMVFPRGMFTVRLDGKRANKRAVHGAAGFIFLYFLILAAAALLVSSGGMDVLQSIITAAVCQGNIGLGTYIPFYEFPSYIKLGLCFVMIIGRLEISIVLILFNWNFWRR